MTNVVGGFVNTILNILDSEREHYIDNEYYKFLQEEKNNLRYHDNDYAKLRYTKGECETAKQNALRNKKNLIDIESTKGLYDARVGAPNEDFERSIKSHLTKLIENNKYYADLYKNSNGKVYENDNKILYNRWVDEQKEYVRKILEPNLYNIHGDAYKESYDKEKNRLFSTLREYLVHKMLEESKFREKRARDPITGTGRRRRKTKSKKRSKRKSKKGGKSRKSRKSRKKTKSRRVRK